LEEEVGVEREGKKVGWREEMRGEVRLYKRRKSTVVVIMREVIRPLQWAPLSQYPPPPTLPHSHPSATSGRKHYLPHFLYHFHLLRLNPGPLP